VVDGRADDEIVIEQVLLNDTLDRDVDRDIQNDIELAITKGRKHEVIIGDADFHRKSRRCRFELCIGRRQPFREHRCNRAALPHVKSGKVKAYGVTSASRFFGAPEVPTMAQAGLAGLESEELWCAMFAPARTARAIIEKLNGDIVDLLKTPATRDALRATGAEPAPSTPAQLAAFVLGESAALKKVVQLAGIRAD
jgi:hypothetical protein